MAKKKGTEKPKREMTRRQLTMWQKQQRRHRLIRISGFTVLAVAIVLVLVGLFVGEVLPRSRTVIRVYDAKFNAGYFLDSMKIAGMLQQTDSLDSLSSTIVRDIMQDELIREGAVALDIEVSDAEAKQTLKDAGLPVNDASIDYVRAQLLQGKLYNNHFLPQVPQSAPQAHILGMFLESESQARDVRARLVNGESFEDLADNLSLNAFSKTNKGDLGWHTEDIFQVRTGSAVPGEYAFGAEAGTLSQPRPDDEQYKQVGYWLLKVLERPYEDQAQTQGLLLASQEEAENIRARLEAGEDLVSLAEEYSQYAESQKQGGELGLLTVGNYPGVVDNYLFDTNTEVGVWSQPLRDDQVWTQGGYWIIDVLEKEDNRDISDADRSYLAQKDLNEWVSGLWIDAAADIDESGVTPEFKQWAIEQVTEYYQSLQGQRA